MKQRRSSYSYSLPEADILAKSYIDLLAEKRELKRRLIDLEEKEASVKKNIEFLLKNGNTKTANAYLVQFSLNKSGTLEQKLMMKL